MIDRQHELPLVRQAVLVGLSRGAIYYEPRALPARDLMLMRRIDELHLELPFAGSRMLRDLLNAEGHWVGRRHVATLMKRMGIEAIYRKKMMTDGPFTGTDQRDLLQQAINWWRSYLDRIDAEVAAAP